MLLLVEGELRSAGVTKWEITWTRAHHCKVLYTLDGQVHSIGFSGSADWRARYRTRSILRRQLRGTA